MSSPEEFLPAPMGGNLPEQQTVQAQGVVAQKTQEVQAAMVIAKNFPRDEVTAYNKLMEACKRPKLAEAAIYQYPRGGTRIEGPSIHLARAAARCWGNMTFGIVELEQRRGESLMEAFAWDLETNARETRQFVVKHERKAKGQITKLDDARDIYEMNANMGARRLRACILGLIPNDITDAAVEQCNHTMSGDSKEPIIDRVKKMISAFADLSVNQDMIERLLGYKAEAANERDLAKLRKIYNSIKDGVAKREDWFDVAQQPQKTDLDKKFEEEEEEKPKKPAKGKGKKKEPKEPPPAPPESDGSKPSDAFTVPDNNLDPNDDIDF